MHRRTGRAQIKRYEARILSRRPRDDCLIRKELSRSQRRRCRYRVLTRIHRGIAERGLSVSIGMDHFDLGIRAYHVEEHRRASGRGNVTKTGGERLRIALRGVGRDGGRGQHQRRGLLGRGVAAATLVVGDFEYSVTLRGVNASVRPANQIVDAAAGRQGDAGAGRIAGEVGAADAQARIGRGIEGIKEQRLGIAVGLPTVGQHSKCRHLQIGQDGDGRRHRTIGAANLHDPGGGAADSPSVNCA